MQKNRDPERLILQGLPKELHLLLPKGKTVKAAGNAYPVPLIIATLNPMLLALHRSGLDLVNWPPKKMLSDKTPDSLPAATKAFATKGKIVDKKKAMAKKQADKRRQKKQRRNEDK